MTLFSRRRVIDAAITDEWRVWSLSHSAEVRARLGAIGEIRARRCRWVGLGAALLAVLLSWAVAVWIGP